VKLKLGRVGHLLHTAKTESCRVGEAEKKTAFRLALRGRKLLYLKRNKKEVHRSRRKRAQKNERGGAVIALGSKGSIKVQMKEGEKIDTGGLKEARKATRKNQLPGYETTNRKRQGEYLTTRWKKNGARKK